MTPRVIKVRVGPEFCLDVQFENGERGVLDMKPSLDFGVFRALQVQTRFAEAGVAFGTIEWPGGLDLDPVFVYKNCEKAVPASA